MKYNDRRIQIDWIPNGVLCEAITNFILGKYKIYEMNRESKNLLTNLYDEHFMDFIEEEFPFLISKEDEVVKNSLIVEERNIVYIKYLFYGIVLRGF